MVPIMPLTDNVLLLLFSLSIFLGSHAAPSSLGSPGSIALFLDAKCEKPSSESPNAKLALSTCLVTHGALGISIVTRPQCPSGNPLLQLFEDTSCMNGINTDLSDNFLCYSNGSRGISAAAWECAGAAEAFAATATSAVEAGTVLPVATSDAGAAALATVSAQSTTTKEKTGVATATTSQSALTSFATRNPSQTGTSSANTSETGSGEGNGSGDASPGLSRTDQIALGVVLPTGAIVTALLAWLWPKPFKKGKQNERDKVQAVNGPPLSGVQHLSIQDSTLRNKADEF